MKTLTSLLFALTICITAQSQDFSKSLPSNVNSEQSKIAEAFADNFFTQLKHGFTYDFADYAIDEIKNKMTAEVQKATYKQIKDSFGDYQSATYTETWKQTSNPDITIYRFKSTFDNSAYLLEIRVVLNSNNKIAGFWVKPWIDQLK